MNFSRMIKFSLPLIAFYFAVMPCCVQANPDTETSQNRTDTTTAAPIIQMTPRARYISDKMRQSFLEEAAMAQMRQRAETETRVFYTTPEESEATFSVGDTRDGYLIHGKALPSPNPWVRQLPVQYERGIIYGTTELISLIMDTAKAMQKRYPGSIMMMGNMGLREGGDIPYSVSHNAGRDADIAFYMVEAATGEAAYLDNMYKINGRLLTQDGKYRFDLEKNTTLIEQLLSHPGIDVQFIFVAKHLRQAILRTLKRREASPEVMRRFEAVVQIQAAHNDHFHVRVYCSKADICAGCVDRSLIHAHHEDPVAVRASCVEKHARILSRKSSSADEKAASLQRLALMGEAQSYEASILKSLRHEEATVRAAAALAAQSLGKEASAALAAQYEKEQDGDVRLALLKSLIQVQAAAARGYVHEAIARGGQEKSAMMPVIIDYIRHYPETSDLDILLTAFEKATDEAQRQTLLSLAYMVANRPTCTEEYSVCFNKIKTWYEENRHKTRNDWLISGFAEGGFVIPTLSNEAIPVLLDAIMGEAEVSHNARLVLSSLSHQKQDTLSWTAHDARWYFTRYFKRRAKKYKIDLSDRDMYGNRIAAETVP